MTRPAQLERLFFHGTGARRRQSIEKRGLLPKLNSYVYASSDPVIASIFALGRSVEEDDWGLLVVFRAGEGWEADPQFPHSFRRREPVPPSDVVSVEVITDLDKEKEAYDKLREIATTIGIKVE